MKSRSAQVVLLAASAALTAAFAGCAGPNTKSVAGVSATEYEQVYVLGSHIPVLVPKNSGLRPVHTTSPATIIKQDDIQRALGHGPINMH